MKKVILLFAVPCAVLLLFCACNSGQKADTEPASSSNGEAQELKVRESAERPVRVRYERLRNDRTPGENAAAKANTTDSYMIDDLLAAIDGLTIAEPTTVDADETPDVIFFLYEDGSEERAEFLGGALRRDGTCYRTEGFDALRAVLDRMLENFCVLEQSYAFTATPYQDDRDGRYWIFYGNGYGARFTGFDGDWFTGEQLYGWGVDTEENILYVFPDGGEEEAYPLTVNHTVDDTTIELGAFTLKEVYPKELDALYVQWAPIGDRIKARLEGSD
ncbi:MAG: hypothetical protein IJK89_01535 [Clostridia bacterium]|nr:hypothetical protein [Clostridia bacterium]